MFNINKRNCRTLCFVVLVSETKSEEEVKNKLRLETNILWYLQLKKYGSYWFATKNKRKIYEASINVSLVFP